jgi:hypothetical protein
MAMQKIAVGTASAIAALALVATVLGLLVTTSTITNTGNVKAVGVNVYWDSACTNVTSSIDWGALDPGGAKSFTVYVLNSGSVPLSLSMTTSNWVPSAASDYISLDWNRQSYVLSAGSVVQAVLTLSVSSSVNSVTSFSFDITITGTEHA